MTQWWRLQVQCAQASPSPLHLMQICGSGPLQSAAILHASASGIIWAPAALDKTLKNSAAASKRMRFGSIAFMNVPPAQAEIDSETLIGIVIRPCRRFRGKLWFEQGLFRIGRPFLPCIVQRSGGHAKHGVGASASQANPRLSGPLPPFHGADKAPNGDQFRAPSRLI
jgi:hypothetical protein